MYFFLLHTRVNPWPPPLQGNYYSLFFYYCPFVIRAARRAPREEETRKKSWKPYGGYDPKRRGGSGGDGGGGVRGDGGVGEGGRKDSASKDFEPAWAAAAASRKSNPYLDEWGALPHVEFKETIDAAKLALSLLEIGAQLATEMRYDLHNIEKENDRLRLKYKHKHVFQKKNTTKTGSDSDVMDERLAPVFMGGSDGFTEAKSSTAAGDIKW